MFAHRVLQESIAGSAKYVTVAAFEIRMVASPTRGSFGQVALFVQSLRDLGYSSSDVFVRVFLGASCDDEIDPLWLHAPDGVNVVWAEQERVKQNGIFAQCDMTFSYQDFSAPLVVYSDTDTIWLARIDELLEKLTDSSDAIAGVIAHNPPPWQPTGAKDAEHWSALGQATVGSPITLDYAYSIRRDVAAPFYPNFGFVAMHSRIMETKGREYLTLADRAGEFLKSKYFKYQVAVPLLCKQYGILTMSLSPIYNFANDPTYEALYPTLVRDAKVIHYLRCDRYDRAQIFSEPAAFHDFLQTQRSGIDLVLQERVRHVWPYPPPHLANGA